MTLKTFSDTAQTFTFTYDFEDIDTARVASNAVFGYMFGTYHAPVIEATIKGKGQLMLEYAEDKELSKIFKRICDGFKDYYNNPQAETVESKYKLERVEQLKQSEGFDSLLDKVVAYELELMDYAERLLSDNPSPDCGRRCRKLYKRYLYFSCGTCQQIHKQTLNRSKTDCQYYWECALREARKVESGWTPKHGRYMFDSFPSRPKRMRHTRYWKHYRRFMKYLDKGNSLWLR